MKIHEVKNTIINLLLSTDRKGITDIIDLLNTSDFYTAPASTKYHGNYEGGLAQHSLNVYNQFSLKCHLYKLKVPRESIILCSILHDILKINTYTKGTKWRKDKKDNWEEYQTYLYEDKLPIGHGEKSIIILQKYIKLTDQEIMLIRWHMGTFNLSSNEMYTYYDAVELYPEIVALHTADYEATTFLEPTIKY